ncbi:MAG: hypothetical protein GY856_01715 [bacterium]|nr:hypothetical protein [bacterium]
MAGSADRGKYGCKAARRALGVGFRAAQRSGGAQGGDSRLPAHGKDDRRHGAAHRRRGPGWGAGSAPSFAQERQWFLVELDPDAGAYNLPDAARLRGRLELATLEASFQEIVRRHEVLRTTFRVVDGGLPGDLAAAPAAGGPAAGAETFYNPQVSRSVSSR